MPTVQMPRRRRERRLEAEKAAELAARLGGLQFAVGRAAACLAAVGHRLVVGGRHSSHARRGARVSGAPRSGGRRHRGGVLVLTPRVVADVTPRRERLSASPLWLELVLRTGNTDL